MKKIFNLTTILFWCALIFAACSSEEGDIYSDVLPQESNDLFSFKYKDKVYSSRYIETNEDIILLDEEMDFFRKRILEQPNSVTLIIPNTIIEYFDNEDSYYESKGIDKDEKDENTRANQDVRLDVWENENYSGKTYRWTGYTEVPDLSKIGMNDCISSLKLYFVESSFGIANSAMVLLYENKNYDGRITTYQLDRSYPGLNVSPVKNKKTASSLKLKTFL